MQLTLLLFVAKKQFLLAFAKKDDVISEIHRHGKGWQCLNINQLNWILSRIYFWQHNASSNALLRLPSRNRCREVHVIVTHIPWMQTLPLPGHLNRCYSCTRNKNKVKVGIELQSFYYCNDCYSVVAAMLKWCRILQYCKCSSEARLSGRLTAGHMPRNQVQHQLIITFTQQCYFSNRIQKQSSNIEMKASGARKVLN